MAPTIYLDHAATSPLRPEAREAMLRGFDLWANPSSPHRAGRAARAALEDARARIKAAVGWEGELIFTSGASEAIALAMARTRLPRRIVSAVEHEAVFRAAPGADIVPVREGEVDADALDGLLKEGPALVAVQHTNSETGTVLLPSSPSLRGGEADAAIQSTALLDCHGLRPRNDGEKEARKPLVDQVRAAGGLLLCDTSQSAGSVPDGADMVVLSSHKRGGPVGAGALLVRDFAMLEPVGGHEYGYRMGTENLPAILGFAAAIEAGAGDWRTSDEERNRFRDALRAAGELISPGMQSNHIVALALAGISANAALVRLDAMGIAVSAGSACSSGTLKRSRALEGFGVSEEIAARTIRISLGWSTTPGDLAACLDALETVTRRP